ncbi:MAG: P1 family peptidase [Gaiellaceae bacterium]
MAFRPRRASGGKLHYDVTMYSQGHVDALFEAVIDATEEAILNALLAAETITGRAGNTAHALPHDLLLDALI